MVHRLRVVDRRRAFFVVLMLALYPIFNFKGFKYNPDLLQLVTLPLLVLAYLNAFEKRDLRAGVLLGLAGALALMTKYWVLTMIGAIGLAALAHPDRLLFLRSPAPWVAIATLVVAMLPHLSWLREVDFVPLTYAGDVYGVSDRAENIQRVFGYVGHNIALLALPVALASLALAWAQRWWRFLLQPFALFSRTWSRGGNAGVNLVAGAQYLDHPGNRRGRSAARRPVLQRLYEDRLGHLAVLPDAAGAGRDSGAAPSKDRAVLSGRDLARDHVSGAGGLAHHR